MKSTLLKIIIVAAFAGILIVLAASLILNSNSELKAFEALTSKQATVNFNEIDTGGRLVQYKYSSNSSTYIDEYSAYMCDVINYLQSDIENQIGLLKYIKGLTRKEKDELINLNDSYINLMREAANSLNVYNTRRNAAKSDGSLQLQMPAISADFVRTLKDAYEKGSALYKELVKTVEKYGFGGNSQNNYTSILYEILNTYADNSMKFIDARMLNRIETLGAGGETALNSNVAAANFKRVQAKFGIYSTSDELYNSTRSAFIKAYNKINFLSLSTNASYTTGMPAETLTSVSVVKTFLNNTFGITTFMVKEG